MAGGSHRPEDLTKVELLICDLDGVLYRGTRAIAGARHSLERLEREGIEVLFVTNNSTKTRREAADHIRGRSGYMATEQQVLTSGDATATLLRETHISAVFVLGESALEQTLREHGLTVTADPSAAEVVVVGLDRGLTYQKLSTAMEAVNRGAILYATNTDAAFPSSEGLQPGAGSLVAAVETGTGVDAIVCGKPNEPMRRLIRERVGERLVVVLGDRLETDVALGVEEGWASILVQTGVTRWSGESSDTDLVPTVVVPSIVEAAELLIAS